MHLHDYIKLNQILIFDQLGKETLLESLIQCLQQTTPFADPERLKQEVFYREKLMSTGIGLGVAIPHVRYQGIREPLIAVGIIKQGIPDYQSIDDQLIQIVFLVVVAKEQHKEYLQLMAQIVKSMKMDGMVSRLVEAPDPAAVHRILVDAL